MPAAVGPAEAGTSSAAICDRAGVTSGVGSYVTQPSSSNHASTHAWASVSRTIQASRRLENPPGLKPVATRAGTPPIRRSSAIAPEKCWQ
jgi:hypothetical protein